MANFFSLISPNKSSSNYPLKTNSRRGRVPACMMAILNRSCFVISNISSKEKSSVAFSFRFWVLQDFGSPSLPFGRNYYKLSFMQSNIILLWMCRHSAKKFLSTRSAVRSLSLTFSKSKRPSEIGIWSWPFSRLSFLLFSILR